MLWKYGAGPMIAASVADYVLVEAHNMQLPRDSYHRSLVPRIQCKKSDDVYSTAYFTKPELVASTSENAVTVSAKTGLSDKNLRRMEGDIDRAYTYTLTPDGIRILVEGVKDAKFILPVISGEVKLVRGTLEKKETIFFLTGGFEASEHTILPDDNNTVELILK